MILSASLERGVIVHLNGIWWLEHQDQLSLLTRVYIKAYQIFPESISPDTSMGFPLPSRGLPILKVARMDPVVNHMDLRASDSPGLKISQQVSDNKHMDQSINSYQ